MKLQHRLRKIAVAFFILLAAGGGSYYYLKLPYTFPGQRDFADNFVKLVVNNQLAEAYKMTSRTRFTGLNYEEFKERVEEELPKSSYKIRYTDTKQTNGNRLRRLIKGRPVDPPRVSVAFEFPLLRVDVCRMNDNQWKVCRFNTHAG